MLARTQERAAWFALHEGKLSSTIMERINSSSSSDGGGVVFAYRDFEKDRLGHFGEEIIFAARVGFMINR